MIRAHGEDADQPGHPPSLIRVFAVHSVGSHRPKVSSCGQRTLIRQVDAHVDLGLHLAGHFVGFAVRRLNLFQGIKGIGSPSRVRVSCIPLK